MLKHKIVILVLSLPIIYNSLVDLLIYQKKRVKYIKENHIHLLEWKGEKKKKVKKN